MSDAQIEAVGWIAVVFLGLAALLWLADLVFGIVQNDDQRKILNRTIGGTFLGGIVAGSVAVLGGDDPVEPIVVPTETPTETPTLTLTPTPQPPVVPTPSPTPADTSPTVPSPTPSPAPSPSPSPPVAPPLKLGPQEVVTCTLPHPSAIMERASQALGPRPDLNCYKKEDYPECVAELRELSREEVSKFDARECSVRVEKWRAKFVTPSEQARVPYLPKLNSAERQGRFDMSAQGLDWLGHIEAEINRMNGTSWEAYNTIVKRSEDDMEKCWHDKCSPAADVSEPE